MSEQPQQAPSEKIRLNYQEIYEAWKMSGLTKLKFCEANGYSAPYFYSWCARQKREGNKKGMRLLPVQTPASTSAIKTSVMEVVWPTGWRLRFSHYENPEFIAKLIKELEICR